jgi:trk system potassium uptake protein TrkH
MNKFKISSTQTIFGSFLLTIFVGAFLLMLPISSNSGQPTNFLTCLFTSTSSLCVTGLVLVDTATHWSFFGQLIILILIQIGGLGVFVVISIIFIFMGQKMNIVQRSTLQESLSIDKVGGIINLILFIIKIVASFELIGAVLLFFQFIKDFNLPTAIWYSVFHSISAFCNAGFDLMGVRGEFSSLTTYQSNILVNLTLMLLIVFGGLGFYVWNDITNKRFKFNKYKLQSKLVIITTIFLILIPTVYFFFFEYKDLTMRPRILSSLFQSITTRTAGFNTANFNEMSEVGKAISIMLMLIGGSPGSTAGGMKTTTFATLLISTFAVYKRYNEPHIFNRRIEIQIIKNAITIFMMYLNLFLIAGFVICKIEDVSLMEALFETASAIGTVGLTLGISAGLSEVSQILLMLLMFLGRVGGLTFIYSIIPSIDKEAGYISENIAVG